MSGVDLHFAVAELAPLQGKRIAKIRKTAQGIYLFKIGASEILFEPGVRLHLTMQLLKATGSPDGFVSYLRKKLEGKTAARIEQHGNDRIVEIEAKSKERLVFELFRKGNIILVLEDGTVDACLVKDEAGGRKIAKGRAYEYPKATPYKAKLPQSPKFFVKEGEGGVPVSFSCEGGVGEGKGFGSFSQAADHYYANQKPQSEEEKRRGERIASLKSRLGSQEEALAKLEEERGRELALGKALQKMHSHIEELLLLVSGMRKAGKSEEEINRELARHSATLKGAVVEIEAEYC